MEKPKLTDLLSFEQGHIKLENWAIKCLHCGEKSNSIKMACSLKTHIHTYYGFILMHMDCKPNEPSEIAKIFKQFQ